MISGVEALRGLPRAELWPLIGIPAYFLIGLAIFYFQSLRNGIPHSARFDRVGKAKVVPLYLLEYGYFMLNSQVRLFLALGVSADLMTLMSLAFAVVGAVYIGAGSFGLGGWLMFFSFFCDAYDGIIARANGTSSARGEYFDSFIDRYADFVTGLGFLYYYRNEPIEAAIVAAGMMGSAAMGYARAKGEAVGVDPNVGVMQRHERAAWIGVLTVTAPIFSAFIEPGVAHPHHYSALFALGLVAVLSNASACWRAAYVMRRLPRPSVAAPSRARHNGSGGPQDNDLSDDDAGAMVTTEAMSAASGAHGVVSSARSQESKSGARLP